MNYCKFTRLSVFKKNITKVFSVLLACITLATSIGWSINVHYCGVELINYAFIGEAEGCGMEELEETCDFSDAESSVSKSCCFNKDLTFKSDNLVRKFKTVVDHYQMALQQPAHELKFSVPSELDMWCSSSSPPVLPISKRLALVQSYII